ncbi:MAG: hypothetical protein MUO76_16415 [Anaerolineaceae bacterium]|nr:hypothetical protein [Anaerolineaceae bacterium]
MSRFSITIFTLALVAMCVTFSCPLSTFPFLKPASEDNTTSTLPQSTYTTQPTVITSTSLPQTNNTQLPTDTHSPTEQPASSPTVPIVNSMPIGENSVTYDVVENIQLKNDGSAAASRILLWVALIQNNDPYQTVLSMQIIPPEKTTTSDEYGNLYAEFEFTDIAVEEIINIEIQYTVLVNQVQFDLSNCTGSVLDTFTNAETYLESDSAAIIELSNSLTSDAADVCAQSRAIYDYLGDNMVYSGYMSDDIGALKALEKLEGDCTEFSDLFISLNRAADIPAHFLEGVTCCTENGYEAGQNKHNWAEVYLPNIGWVPVDPTWGRYANNREEYFSKMTPDHILITRGRNLDTLLDYHFYAYRYWWDGDSTTVSSEEEWSILKKEN